MSCPRCGYPETIDECRLCGQTDLDTFELDRYREGRDPRFELTLVFPDTPESSAWIPDIPSEVRRQRTDEIPARYYLFFPDGAHSLMGSIFEKVKQLPGWKLYVNGRFRPFTEELWLPLLQILHQPEKGT